MLQYISSPVSNLSQNSQFSGLVAEEGLGRSVSVACLALTLKTETHGEPIFNVAWCCQPHQMGHRQHPNLKMGEKWKQFLLFIKNSRKIFIKLAKFSFV